MPGPAPKPAEKRLRRNKPRQIVPMPKTVSAITAPPPPRGLLKAISKQWERYWKSAIGQAVDIDTDLPAITRLFILYDERERA
ncbi:MAG: hypothetical protein JRI77_09575 [Deltaproteobacteria bacterium]|nr:hypothetical protein [Deltaproteobacteria bacterium]